MSELLENLARALENSPQRIRERLAGKVTYGVFELDPKIAAKISEDGTETFGRFDEAGVFVPFTEEENTEFKKRKYREHFTEIFDKKGNVIPFPVRKPPSI